jgi:hypothetical protein
MRVREEDREKEEGGVGGRRVGRGEKRQRERY